MRKPTLALLLIVLTSAGCALIPPKRIPVDRLEYLEAINTSWKEQLLKNLVMLREGDSTFLELTNVTTGYNLGGQAMAQYNSYMGFSAKQGGNDVIWSPASGQIGPGGSASINYSRTPSVTYSPIRGENLRKMLDQIEPDNVIKILRVNSFAPYILALMVESITLKVIRDEVDNQKVEPQEETAKCKKEIVESNKKFLNNSDDFYKLLSLFNKLYKQGIINIETGSVKQENITEKTEEFTEETSPAGARSNTSTRKGSTKPTPKKTTTKTVISDVKKYYLTISILTDDVKPFDNLLSCQLKASDKIEISIQTRSIMQILAIFSQPGLVNGLDSKELSGSKLMFRINQSIERPKDVFVTIKHRGFWFSIENNDNDSKKIFSLLVSIWAMNEGK